jgi:preprotein translocase subunit Sec63
MKLLDIINEQDDNNPITDKDRKKIRTVFAAFSGGVIKSKGTNPTIRYQLANHYSIEKKTSENVFGTEQKKLNIILWGKSFENVTIYIINEDGTETQVTPYNNMWNGMLWVVGRRIEVLFNRYDIGIVLNFF